MRRLIGESGEWDESVYGVPLSSAHLGLASSVFCAMLLRDVERLGAGMIPEARAGSMHIWRYPAVLSGVPDAILFGDEADAHEICRIRAACEPEPGEPAIVMANSLLNVAPVVSGSRSGATGRSSRTTACGFRGRSSVTNSPTS